MKYAMIYQFSLLKTLQQDSDKSFWHFLSISISKRVLSNLARGPWNELIDKHHSNNCNAQFTHAVWSCFLLSHTQKSYYMIGYGWGPKTTTPFGIAALPKAINFSVNWKLCIIMKCGIRIPVSYKAGIARSLLRKKAFFLCGFNSLAPILLHGVLHQRPAGILRD